MLIKADQSCLIVIDVTMEQEDVIKRHGRVPRNIHVRFVERERRIAGAYPDE